MADKLQLFLERIDTPIGELVLVADRDKNLRAVDWTEYEHRMHRFLRLHYGKDGFSLEPAPSPSELASAMKNYFAGELDAIDKLPVQTAGTPFQRAVWSALREIPRGATESYGKLAQRIGRPTAIRAVGLANGSNPKSAIRGFTKETNRSARVLHPAEGVGPGSHSVQTSDRAHPQGSVPSLGDGLDPVLASFSLQAVFLRPAAAEAQQF